MALAARAGREAAEEELGRDVVVAAYAKHFGISHSAAAVLLAGDRTSRGALWFAETVS